MFTAWKVQRPVEESKLGGRASDVMASPCQRRLQWLGKHP